MKVKVVSHAGRRRLILLMAGWAMDSRPFEHLAAPGYDVAVVWDWTDDTLPLDPSLWDEVIVIAWSYGVAMTARWLAGDGRRFPVTRRVAVNGTMWPVDACRGIAPAIFSATLARLDEASLAKFYRRMAGGAAALAAVSLPRRTIDSLRAELGRIARLAPDVEPVWWDEAVIARADAIIPPDAQRAAWTRYAYRVTEIDAPHLPPFSSIIARVAVDKDTVAARFSRATATYTAAATVQQRVAETLVGMIPSFTAAPRVLEIGTGTGILTRLLDSRLAPASLTLVDLVGPQVDTVAPSQTVAADAETFVARAADCSFDLVASASTIQWFNSLPQFLHHAARILRPGGILALATYGPANFSQLDGIAERRHFPALDEIRAMLPPSLRIVSEADETVDLTFDTPLDILRHLHATGVNTPVSPGAGALSLLRHYPLDPDGRASITFNPLYIILLKQ